MKKLGGVNLDSLQKDAQSSFNRNRILEVKKGLTYFVRFLPVDMGNGKFYVKHSSYWVNKKPTTSLAHTDECIGGKPNFRCPVEEAITELKHGDMNSRQEEFISRVGPSSSFMTLCVLIDVLNRRGGSEMTKEEEDNVYVPYYFKMSASTLSDFGSLMHGRKGKSGSSDLGVLDYESGCNIAVSKKDSNGYIMFQKEQVEPILIDFAKSDKDYDLDKTVRLITSNYSEYKINVPKEDTLHDLADQIRELFFDLEGGKGGRSNGRRNRVGHDGDNDDDDRDTGDRQPRRERSRSQEDDSEEDDIPPRRERSRSQSDDISPRRERSRSQEDEGDDIPPRRERSRSQEDDIPPRRERSRSQEDDIPPRRERSRSQEDDIPPRRNGLIGEERKEAGRVNYRDDDDDIPMDHPPKSIAKGKRDEDDDELMDEDKSTDVLRSRKEDVVDDDIDDDLPSSKTREPASSSSSLKDKLKSYTAD